MSAGLLRPLIRTPLLWAFLVGSSNVNFAQITSGVNSAQIEGSAGQQGAKPFTATVAIREGYDSNP
jgi:hypothetical protein